VPENEIEAIRAMIASGRGVMPWPVLRLGQRVRIEAGPLHGVEGILVREKSIYRVVVSVELLNRGVAVEIDREEIRPIPVALPGTAALRRERVA
jgi:transcription antitermination factor NusG